MLKNIKKMLKKEEKIEEQSRAYQMIRILRPEAAKEKKKTKETKYPRFKILSTRKISISNIPPVRYPLIDPYAFAVIKKEPFENTLVYRVGEPILNREEEEKLTRLKHGLLQTINISMSAVRDETGLIEFLEEKVQDLLSQYGFSLTSQQYLKIMYYIYRDFVGLNEIEPLMHDPFIEDIGVDGVGIPVYIVHQKFGSLKTNIIYNDIERLREFVVKLAERCDRYISYAEPLLDGTLPDGSRVQATLTGDITTKGPTFSIRKFRGEPLSPVDMIMLKTASSELIAYLWYTIEARRNILICGGTSTGKTSFLNAISLFISPESKIVSIEDTRELSLPHEHWIPGVARTGFGGTNVGEVTMFDLLRESFRQNPDYLIVGEIRGKEAYVMFQGMASGHPSFSTIHAASLDDVIKRLESPPIELSPSLIEALDIIIVMIHAREKGKSARRIKEVMEIQNIDKATGSANAVRAFAWIPSEDRIEYKGYSWVLNKISIDKGIPIREIYREIDCRKRVLDWLVNKNIRSIKNVSKYIVMYQRDKDQLLKMIREG
ncbi:MAG: type II/IV secretion system ATPase subunit [Candidatus Aenigmatarchaeota archaeon]